MAHRLIVGDALETLRTLPDESVQCCVTSPPYWGLRDYGVPGQLGLEATPQEYVARMVEVFSEVRRVLRDDGTLWVNMGDSYNGYMANQRATSISANNQSARPVFESGHGRRTNSLKNKDLVGIPWRLAFALQDDGWWLRCDVIWSKPNPMPESVRDRPTKAHEYLFLLSKSARYYYDADAIAEPGTYLGPNGAQKSPYAQGFARRTDEEEAERRERKSDKQRGHGRRHAGFNDRWDEMEKAEQCGTTRNARSVWTIATKPFPEAHFATFPPEIPRRCILAGSKPSDTVLDPFAGAGTTGLVAVQLGREFIGIELNAEYAKMAERRIASDPQIRIAQEQATLDL